MVHDIVNQPNEVDSSTSSSNTTIVDRPSPIKGKSKVGRKAIDDAEKKQQVMLTIEASSKARLEGVDKKNFKKLLGRYIDKNIDEIVEAIEKL